MPSWTFQQIQNRVESYVLELPQATLDEIPTLVNEAIRDAEDLHNFKVMEATQEFTTTEADHALGTMATDFKELRDDPWLRFADGGNRAIAFVSDEVELVKLFAINDPNEKSRPKVLYQKDEAGVLEVYPFPDGLSDHPDGEYRVNVPYWKYLPDLTLPVDTNWFLNTMPTYVLYKSVSIAHALNFNDSEAAKWEARGVNQLKLHIRKDKRSRTSRSHVLVPRNDVHGSVFQERR